MTNKKFLNEYYLLVSEGTTEFNLFAYLTTNKFRKIFDKSKIKFSSKVEILEANISQGKLGGVGNIKNFESKYNLIKEKYKGQKRFFLLDKDLDDSSKIEKLIKQNGDIIQFIEYNSEYLLLKFSGENLKNHLEFKDLPQFRQYCKSEFFKKFGKKASEFKDTDFDSVFDNVKDATIEASFKELFSILK